MKREIMICDRCRNRVGPDNPAVISERLSDGRQFQICGICFLDMEAVASIETNIVALTPPYAKVQIIYGRQKGTWDGPIHEMTRHARIEPERRK